MKTAKAKINREARLEAALILHCRTLYDLGNCAGAITTRQQAQDVKEAIQCVAKKMYNATSQRV